MFNIGDVVNYKDKIGMVVSVEPLTLALCDGTSSEVSPADAVLLLDYKELIEQFESVIIRQTGG